MLTHDGSQHEDGSKATAAPPHHTQALRPAWRLRQILLVGSQVTALVAFALFLWDVDSVLVTGPILIVAGILLLALSLAHGHRLGAALGLGHVLICVLFVMLVNLLTWGGSYNEEIPFLLMGTVYLLLTTPLTWLAWQRQPRQYQPWECQQCGYPLVGLPGPTCPECGAEFDPAAVRAEAEGSRVGAR